MGKFLAGVALASLGWALAWWQLGGGLGGEPCRGLCGAGTSCDGERCVPEAPAIERPADEAEATSGKVKRRRRGRKRRGAADAADAAPGEGDALPPFEPVNDRHIPPYRDKTVNLDEYGGERLPDATVDQHMNKLTGRFQECITAAAMYSDAPLGAGTLSFKIRLLPTGKVDGVTVRAPGNLKVFGIVPCARKVVYDHRFPTYDGPPMGVDFSFEVG